MTKSTHGSGMRACVCVCVVLAGQIINLMMAQAQSCFFEKAVTGTINPTILAKIAKCASDMYSTVMRPLTVGLVSGW